MFKRKTGFLGLIILLNFSFVSFSQKPSKLDNSWIRVQGNFGALISEYQFANYLVNKPLGAFEISWNKRTTGKNLWEQVYKFPEYGITFQYTSLGNPTVFGHEVALYPYMQGFFYRGKKMQVFHQFGFGVGYATKRFHLENNYQNIAVGSHLNFHFNFKTGARYLLNDHFLLDGGLTFAHFSNANMSEPNLGLNMVYAFLGVSKSIGKQSPIVKNEIPKHFKKHEFALIYAAGGKHTRALQSDKYFTSSLSGEYKFHWKRKFYVGTGLDLFYDSSTEIEMSARGKDNHRSRDDFRTGIHFSQEIVYDRFSFILQEGFYVGLVDMVSNSSMYNRAILRWRFTENLLVHISMKSHLHILEYPELGFGYHFRTKK